MRADTVSNAAVSLALLLAGCATYPQHEITMAQVGRGNELIVSFKPTADEPSPPNQTLYSYHVEPGRMLCGHPASPRSAEVCYPLAEISQMQVPPERENVGALMVNALIYAPLCLASEAVGEGCDP